jgi:hypothetical protein
MDEYIKRADTIKMIEDDLPEIVYYRKEDAIACLECLPTADVVPRAKVTREIADYILELSDQWGGGVAFYKKMRQYAEELKNMEVTNESIN